MGAILMVNCVSRSGGKCLLFIGEVFFFVNLVNFDVWKMLVWFCFKLNVVNIYFLGRGYVYGNFVYDRRFCVIM